MGLLSDTNKVCCLVYLSSCRVNEILDALHSYCYIKYESQKFSGSFPYFVCVLLFCSLDGTSMIYKRKTQNAKMLDNSQIPKF